MISDFGRKAAVKDLQLYFVRTESLNSILECARMQWYILFVDIIQIKQSMLLTGGLKHIDSRILVVSLRRWDFPDIEIHLQR